MAASFCRIYPSSSTPLSRQCLENSSTSNRTCRPLGGVSIRRDYDRQQRIFQRILLEDIGERCADHGAEPELGQRPGSMLARAAAAEVVARQKDLRARGPRLVEDEIGLGIPLLVVAPV